MIRRAPKSTRTDTLFPVTTLFPSVVQFGVDQGHAIVTVAEPLAHLLVMAGDQPRKKIVLLGVCVVGDEPGDAPGRRCRRHRVEARLRGQRPGERRVGKGCVSSLRSRLPPVHYKKKTEYKNEYTH